MNIHVSVLLLLTLALTGQVAQAETSDYAAFLSEYTLSPEQDQRARAVLNEAEPRVKELYTAISATRKQLHSLSIDSSSKPDDLEHLGERLLDLRNRLRAELDALNIRLEHEVGINPGLGHQRGCARLFLPRPSGMEAYPEGTVPDRP